MQVQAIQPAKAVKPAPPLAAVAVDLDKKEIVLTDGRKLKYRAVLGVKGDKLIIVDLAGRIRGVKLAEEEAKPEKEVVVERHVEVIEEKKVEKPAEKQEKKPAQKPPTPAAPAPAK